MPLDKPGIEEPTQFAAYASGLDPDAASCRSFIDYGCSVAEADKACLPPGAVVNFAWRTKLFKSPKEFAPSRMSLRIAAVTTAIAVAGGAFAQTPGTACPTGTGTFKATKFGIAFLSGTAGISAPVSLKDNGCTLWTYSRRTNGATGMAVQKHYHTLVYDDQSVATGANACIPSVNWLAVNVLNPNPFDLLQVSAWKQIGQSSRSMCGSRRGAAYDALKASVAGSVYALDALGTVSIRRHDQTGPVVNLALVACGAITADTRGNPPQPPDNC